ncbi:hypothetical protein [Brevibacillus sp. NRS-1366]|uniref:hypothetical protein n=1 Tax=Brevibacillus sp. NRS-1366 TaxID=3233899 RepID=UPI003D236D95
MEQLFKCEYTGKIFDNALECQESEYIHGDENMKFIELVYQFVDMIEKKFKLTVCRESLNIYDKLENYINDRMVHWRHLGFTFTINGKEKKYYRESDPVGDGRWDWHMKDLNDMVYDFEKEFIMPRRKKFEGYLKFNYDPNPYSSYHYWTLNGKKIDDILTALNRRGKKVRIEVID